MIDKSKTLRFQAVRLAACSLLLTAWLPLSYAGSGHDHDSDGGPGHGEGGHSHGHEDAPATEAFYPDADNATPTATPLEKEDTHHDEQPHDHHESGNVHHAH